MSALFQTTLLEHFKFGQNLVIKAQAEEDASWFFISLTTKKAETTPTNDVGLHMLVSLSADLIVFKQCLNDNWKELKSIEFDATKFRNIFTVTIIMDELNYHIGINDEPCVYIKYGIPLKRLNTLKIDGHLQTIKQVDHRQHFPYLWPPIQLNENYIDFSNEQPIPFTNGQVMVIKIKLKGNRKGRMILQFRNVWEVTREELHMSIRFDNKTIIWNSKLPQANSDDPEYGKEECINASKFPFDNFFKPFKLAILFTESSLKIAKNGTEIYDYAYRTRSTLRDLMGVKIFGTEGVNVRVCSIDHLCLSEPQFFDFATYSIVKYT